MVQTSMGMSFQPGQPPPPSQPPPQQLYQMGSSMMGTNMPRMGATGSGGPVGQGNGGLAGGTGAMGPSGGGQLNRGPGLTGGLGTMDNRSVQHNQGPPTPVATSGVHVQAPMPGVGPMSSGHPMPNANAGGVVGMGGSLPVNLTTPQMMGDPSTRGYSGMGAMNTGMNAGLNTPLNAAVNSGMTPAMNPGMNTGINTNLNPPMNTGMAPAMSAGVNQGINAPINPAMNSGMNTGLSANMNPGMSSGMNQGMNTGMGLSQGGGFAGTTDGTAVTSTAMQPQTYSQVQMQGPPAPQQPQVPLELEQQKALLQQVMNLTTEQIMSLPPEQRQQVLQLQQALR